MKILISTLTLLAVIILVSIGCTAAKSTDSAPAKPPEYRYTQDTYTTDKWHTNVVLDKTHGVVCYHSVFRGGSLLVTSSCVKL